MRSRMLGLVVSLLALLVATVAIGPGAGARRPGSPSLLTPDVVERGDVVEFLISPDGEQVVYLADADTNNVFELYSVAVGGGDPVRLSGDLAGGSVVLSGGGSTHLAVSPDSARVVYAADEGADGVFGLYSVPIAGGAGPVLLSPPAPTGGGLGDFVISEDSSTVVFRSGPPRELGIASVRNLLSVPIDGGTPIQLNDPLDPDQSVVEFAVSADSQVAVYSVSDEELYAVPLDGGAPVRLNPGGCALSGCLSRLGIAPDSSTVVYSELLANGEYRLFSVPVTGGSPTALNDPWPEFEQGEGSTEGPNSWSISPDSTTVVYSGDQVIKQQIELFAVPIGGGDPRRLNAALPPPADLNSFAISPDSSTVVYRIDLSRDSEGRILATPLAGGAATDLSPDVVDGGTVFGFEVTPDSSTVVLWGRIDGSDVTELYAVDIGGGPRRKLNPPLADKGEVTGGWAISPDSSRVTFRADAESDGRFELYSAPLGGGMPIKLNGPLVQGGDVVRRGHWPPLSFAYTSDSETVVYRADQVVNGQVHAFAVDAGLRCGSSFATHFGDAGPNRIVGTSGPDVIHGLGGHDIIEGKGGDDVICGGIGDDAIKGGPGADVIEGNKGDDTIRGNRGSDVIRGNDGRDTISGGPGGDQVFGGRRADILGGGRGGDALHGNRGNDDLTGGRGTDTCDGSSGTDTADSCEMTVSVP